jgi:hypothetical protein
LLGWSLSRAFAGNVATASFASDERIAILPEAQAPSDGQIAILE